MASTPDAAAAATCGHASAGDADGEPLGTGNLAEGAECEEETRSVSMQGDPH